MEVSIDKDKINQVWRTAGAALSDKGIQTPEVLFGLAELIGRILVEHTGGTIIEKLDAAKPLMEHIERTVRVGCIARQ